MTDLRMPEPNTLLAAIQNGMVVAMYTGEKAAPTTEKYATEFIRPRLRRAALEAIGDYSRGEFGPACACVECLSLVEAIARRQETYLGIQDSASSSDPKQMQAPAALPQTGVQS